MKRKGFSLTELMIALAVFSIISIFLYQTFFSQIRQAFNFNYNIDIQRNVNKALEMLTDEIRNSSYTDVTFEESGGKVTEVLSKDRITKVVSTIIDLNSSGSGNVNYNSVNKILSDKYGNECFNIDSVVITRGGAGNNENDLILITVSASEGRTQITSSTAVNIEK
jgi:prepilin-type N-terminal cleavage/methylation domain-containing protein